ncbi:hypothetical protein [Brucella intermedia]|uniref:hypothetical protein n=1 Tax=Brucella intermedia TaxID=94625 RepID=UPI002360C29D|nr:hypothetical protein [Brucella intermedia]
MKIRATFDEDGFATGFYPEDIWPEGFPRNALEITEDQYLELLNHPGARKWLNGQVIEYTPPPPPPAATVVPAVSLWERLTEAEAEQVNAAMATQPFRTRQIFMTAKTFRSDHELWPLLVQMATELFGEERTSELLADPSELVANS